MKELKKLLSIVVLMLLMVLTVSAQNFFSRPLLNGWSMIVVTNTTINYGVTNVGYASPANTNLIFSLTNTYYGAVFNAATAANTLAQNMGNGGTVGWWTNSITTNTSIGVWPPAWTDVATVADKNGKVSDNLALTISMRGTNDTTGTNILTFTFTGVAAGGRGIAPGSVILPNGSINSVPDLVNAETAGPGPTVVLAVTGMGTTNVVVRTNLSAAFLQGLGAIRLTKVVSSATGSATTSTFVDAVNLEGWAP